MPAQTYNTSVAPENMLSRGKADLPGLATPIAADATEIIPSFQAHDQEPLYAKIAVDGISDIAYADNVTDYVHSAYGIPSPDIETVVSFQNSEQDYPRVKAVINGIVQTG
jgi:hypothetical protein